MTAWLTLSDTEIKEFLLFTGVIVADAVKMEAALLMEEFVLLKDGVYLTKGLFGAFDPVIGSLDLETAASQFVSFLEAWYC